MSRLRRYAGTVAVCTTLLGCADDSGPPPAGGYSHAAVDYTPKPLVNPTVIDCGTIDLSQDPVPLETLTIPAGIENNGPLAVTAKVLPAAGEPEVVILLIQCLRDDPRLGRVVAQNAISQPTKGGADLRVEFVAPRSGKGKHRLEVKLIRMKRNDEQVLIREGEFQIR